MVTAAGLQQIPQTPLGSGINIVLHARDRLCGALIQRSLSSSGPWTTIRAFSNRQFDGNGIISFIDLLPLDGIARWYRWQHTGLDHPDSGFSIPAKAIPSVIDNALLYNAGSGDAGSGGGGQGAGGLDDSTTQFLNVETFGATPDAVTLNGITMVSGSFQAISTNLAFTFGDVSKSIVIQGAGPGGGSLVSIITEVTNSATISVADPAETSINDVPFLYGTDNRSAIQGVLDMAADADATRKSQVFIPNGAWLIDVNLPGTSLQIADGVKLSGDGMKTSLVAFGANSDPVLTNADTGSIQISDLSIDGARLFHTGSVGSIGILLDNADGSTLTNLFMENLSADAISITGSSGIIITGITGEANGNTINAVDSDNLTMTNIQDSGSDGFGIVLDNVQSSSIAALALDETGSGSIAEINGSEGNTIQGVVPFIDINIPAPLNNPVGSWIQFIEGGPANPGGGTVQGALVANYSGTAPNNWIGIAGKRTGSDDLTDVADLPTFVSWSISTGKGSFGTDVEFAAGVTASGIMVATASQAITASFAETALSASHAITSSFALGALSASHAVTASFALGAGFDGTGSVLIPSLSFGLNEGIDLGVQSSSFTINLHDGNIQRFIPGANLTITLGQMNVGGVILIGVDNDATHSITLPTALWHVGNSPVVPAGTSIYGFTQFDPATLVGYIVGENVKASGGPGLSNHSGSFTGSFIGELIGTASWADSSSFAETSSVAETSSFAVFAQTASVALNSLGADSGSFTGSFTGSLLGTASVALVAPPTITGSFTGSFIGSLLGTASVADSSSFADTASVALSAPPTATGSFTGSFFGEYDGLYSGSFLIPSNSTAIHNLVDVGILSGSSNITWKNSNFKKLTAGADINLTMIDLTPGQVCVLEIDNNGNHVIGLLGSIIWNEGAPIITPTGSSMLTLTELSIGTLAAFAAIDIS